MAQGDTLTIPGWGQVTNPDEGELTVPVPVPRNAPPLFVRDGAWLLSANEYARMQAEHHDAGKRAMMPLVVVAALVGAAAGYALKR